MIDYTSSTKFKRLVKRLKRSDGTAYGCVEINSPQNTLRFISQLQEAVSHRVVEVDFSPTARRNHKENTELVYPYQHYYTIRNFEEKFGADCVLVMTNLDQNTDRAEEAVRQAIAEINMNRENYVRHPGVVIFVFPRWFMDRVLQRAADFVSQMVFHYDLTDVQDDAFQTRMPETPTWGSSEIPVLPMKETYAQQMQDEELPLGERLTAAQKLVRVCSCYYHVDADSKALVEYARRLAEQTEIKNEKRAVWVANVLGELGYYHQIQAEYDQALHYYEKALQLDLEYLGEDRPETAAGYGSIAGVYKYMGDYARALEFYQKDLAISEKVLGTEHPDTATTYNNIAVVYYNMGDTAQALEYYQKARAIREKVLGTEHPDTATAYNNIAGVYDNMGDYSHALEYYQKALAIREKVLGTEHPSTATTYNNIGLVYHNMGDTAQALEYYQKALAIKEKVLGTEHPDTATAYNNIAGVYDNMGDTAQALEYYQKALAIKEKVLGTGHPDTATAYNNIAGVYDNMGDTAQALEFYQKALAICEKVLGTEHPNTALTYYNISFVYADREDWSLALDYMKKAYQIWLNRLGKDHPYTKDALDMLESLYPLFSNTEESFEEWLEREMRE